MSRRSGRARALALDISPLKESRAYRRLWVGRLISEAGRQVTLVALYFQVQQLTGSPAAVGLIGVFQVIPLVASSLAAGAFIDTFDRRKTLVITQWGLVASSGLLLAASLMGRPPLALLYGAAGLGAAFSGIDGPTRQAIVPVLVGTARLPAAMALGQVMFNTTMVVGPLVGGAIIGTLGIPWAYGIDIATYGAGIATAFLLPSLPPVHEGPRPTGFRAIREGVGFLRGKRVIQSTFVVDLIAMIFGMPRALFPVLAKVQFGGGAGVAGMLFAAPAAGALLASVVSGWVGRVRRQGAAVLIAVAIWGAAIAGFGLAGDALPLALGLLAVAGGADVISAVFRSTILHSNIPDSLRGRISAIHILVVTGGPRLGDVEAGLVAQAFSPAVSVVSGGALTLAGVSLLSLLIPQFARYKVPGKEGIGARRGEEPN